MNRSIRINFDGFFFKNELKQADIFIRRSKELSFLAADNLNIGTVKRKQIFKKINEMK